MSTEQIIQGVFIALPFVLLAYCYFKPKTKVEEEDNKVDVYYKNGEWKFKPRNED